MMIRTSNQLIHTLGLCFGLVGIDTANSSEVTNDGLDDGMLIGQLRGHETYDAGEQLQWDGYVIGRVVSKSGNIMTIKVEDDVDGVTVFHAQGSVSPGSDVLVGKDENGYYYFERAAHPEWISHLELKQVTVSSTESSYSEPISQLQEETIVEEKTVVEEETVVEEQEPVRGLW
jgi:hypothetical protein